MGNWHVVMPYDSRAAEWLGEQGFPHPEVQNGNRLPTFTEIEEAASLLGIGPDAPLLIDHHGNPDSFTIRGDLRLELELIRKLSERSGQQWVYPDCGSPAIVVDKCINPERVAAAWLRSLNAEDSWTAFLNDPCNAK